jgi:hypothetical protein
MGSPDLLVWADIFWARRMTCHTFIFFPSAENHRTEVNTYDKSQWYIDSREIRLVSRHANWSVYRCSAETANTKTVESC